MIGQLDQYRTRQSAKAPGTSKLPESESKSSQLQQIPEPWNAAGYADARALEIVMRGNAVDAQAAAGTRGQISAWNTGSYGDVYSDGFGS